MKKLLLKLILFYRHRISPNKGTSCCRFIPSCSEYAYIAVERYGAIKGGALAIWRLLRCNPLCKGGYDPVP
ncbi:MAG: membrane protein insertion efficiency factor YidD [Clostridia bacterium]|nr:membrane protein insertion efficiency factor YidD [Clostridia bacterium]